MKILIADDQQLFVEGLSLLLHAEPAVAEVRFVFNGEEAANLLRTYAADLLVTDLNMPLLDGFGLIRQCRKKYPLLRILAVSVRDDQHAIAECVKAGVNGFLNKIAGREEFMYAIGEIMNGRNYFPETVMQKMFYPATGETPLTQREKEIVKLIATEKTTAEIAAELFISETTVNSHRKKIFEKTGVKNMAGLVRYALQQGLLD